MASTFNVRTTKVLNDDELRTSLRGGWNKELPSIEDEHGAIIVGNRRRKIAAEEQIEPVIKVVTFGDGPDAVAARVRLANVSNIGGAPLTAEDRKAQAAVLYKSGITMEAIAHMLGVAKMTISRDLVDCNIGDNQNRPKTPANPKGAGRKKKPRAQRAPKAEQRERRVAALHDAGLNAQQIAKEVGLGERAVNQALEHEEIKKEARADPAITPDMLSMTAQEKLAAAIRQHKRKLDDEFEGRVLAECKHRMNSISLPHYAKQLEELERSIRSRKGVMDRLTYRKILSCLHPDRVLDPTQKKRYEEAFRLFTELEKRVLDEKESPTEFRRMPRTYEELMAMKAKVQAANRAKRAAHKGANVSPR